MRPIVVRLVYGTQESYTDEGPASFTYVPRSDGYLIVLRRWPDEQNKQTSHVTEAAYAPGSWHRVTGGDNLYTGQSWAEAVDYLFAG